MERGKLRQLPRDRKRGGFTGGEGFDRLRALLELQRNEIVHCGSEESGNDIRHGFDGWVACKGQMDAPRSVREDCLDEGFVLFDG